MKVKALTPREQIFRRLKDCEIEYPEGLDVLDTEFSFMYTGTLTFQDLDKLSTVFNTKEIDFTPETDRQGYCSSCAYDEAVVKITVRNFKL